MMREPRRHIRSPMAYHHFTSHCRAAYATRSIDGRVSGRPRKALPFSARSDHRLKSVQKENVQKER